jgi:23S rRNA G2445 N2-methylase RlmL
MQVFTTVSRIIVTCNKRLSPYLQQEIIDLGFNLTRVFSTGVELQGTVTDCMKLNLHLRCASQVLYSLRQFNANSPDDIYGELSTIPWEQLIAGAGYFSVTSNVDHPTIRTSLFANVKVKDAIVDRMRNQTGTRPNSGPSLDQTVVHLFWREETAEVFLDTSGETLAKHGYRKIPGKAPMLEALASGTVLATRWDRQSPFINPMCGSSTLAIEAALIATKRVPGLYRNNYAFMHVLGYDEKIYQQERQKLDEQIVSGHGLEIIATDISQDAINISKINADAAGVGDLITFAEGDFETTPIPEERNGVVFFNPEYGERLGVEKELEETYKRIGDFLKKQCRGYTGYIFTGNLDLAKKIGLKASRRIEFYTSKIDCRLLEYELYGGTRRDDTKQAAV